jgi:hypothetical protein
MLSVFLLIGAGTCLPVIDGTAVSRKGAFGTSTDNWLAGYSWLACSGKWLACSGKIVGSTCSTLPTAPFATLLDTAVAVGGTLSASSSLTNTTSYLLASQLFEPSAITLTIAAGTSVYGLPVMDTDPAPAIVVFKGGAISASGTFSMPITFTSVLAESALVSTRGASTDSNENAITLGERGKWGGLILPGNAPTNVATTTEIEGITGRTYGGTVATDSSGSLQYVRVWHGGAIIGANNEINGITFGGVGSGTTVAYCEVAYNADDGFEFFGGTVNVKYLSVLFAGDDAFDTDEGYVGKGQFLFAMTGSMGNHGTEMDSLYDTTPRSHPAFYSMTIIGGGASGRLREGTGGKFINVLLDNPTNIDVEIFQCSSASWSSNYVITQQLSFVTNYLYFSSKNIISGVPSGTGSVFSTENGKCPSSVQTFTAVQTDPLLMSAHNLWSRFELRGGLSATLPLDPRPACGSAAYSNVDPVPNGDAFLSATTYKGAFGSVNWLDGWSLFNLPNRPGFADGALDCSAAALSSDPVAVGGTFTVDQVLSVGPTYMLTCQTFVSSGVTMRVQAGVVMYATPVGLNGVAPALVVARGGKIIADGTATATITFTGVLMTSEDFCCLL